MTSRLFALLVLFAAVSTAQTKPVKSAPVKETSVRATMEFLASDALNGRGSGTRDEQIAAEYIASRLREFGVAPGAGGGYVHAVELERGTVTEPPTMTVAGATPVTFTHAREIVMRSLAGPSVSGPLQKYVADQPVKEGAFVFIPDGDRTAAGKALEAHAAAVLMGGKVDPQRWEQGAKRMPRLPLHVKGATGHGLAEYTVVQLSAEAATALEKIADGTTITVSAKLGEPEKSRTWNALGTLKGGDPKLADEVILLSAHLDHVGAQPGRGDGIFNGADDDASGVTAVLELARVLAAGPKPKRTVVFAFFGSEETGGHGSKAFREQHPALLKRMVANLQFELMGRPNPKVPVGKIWMTGFDRSDLGPTLIKQGAPLVADPYPKEGLFARSDNYHFARAGVVAHAISSSPIDDGVYHSPDDELEKIDFPHMTRIINQMIEPVRWLVNTAWKPGWAEGKKP